jgi:hypothetical protein
MTLEFPERLAWLRELIEGRILEQEAPQWDSGERA